MKSDEIRTQFLKYFEEKGHKVIPSSSLIPKGDPTLLLTTAGMVQIKPYFLGEVEPPSRRLASCQKCFRTTDIESVGDASHLTFFEMLGNFSVGDYFKKEAIAWAWEFFIERMKLPPEKLWITIYLDDDEAFEYWRKTGVPAERIVRCGEEDNFWGPAGNTGPCGPCSEIHYDFGIEKGCGKSDCKPNCECGRFKEIWNLVFTQYNQDENGNRTPLPKPNIDTGMGFERIVMVMAGKDTVYDADIFEPLLRKVEELTGRKYGVNDSDDIAMRVVSEHGRALAFLIADGVIPGNEGRGYVLRRLLRRGALYGRRLGLEKSFLSEIAIEAIKKLGHIYLELEQRQDFIVKAITLEETRFEETLKTGLEIIEEVLVKHHTKKSKQVSGEDAFRLYDTYGFPVELTKEIVAERGFQVDMDGFEAEMEKQRERARASHKFTNTERKITGGRKLDVEGTEFVGYRSLEQPAEVVSIVIDGKQVESLKAGQEAGIILDSTPFYGEMGGQVGDRGEINWDGGSFNVTNTIHIQDDVTLHQGKVDEGSLRTGDRVRAAVDIERRRDIARNHTATHLVQAALKQVLGEHIQQRGSLVAPDRLRFDFSHLAAMSRDEIKQVQKIVNDKVRQNLPVFDREMGYKEAVKSGAVALFDEKYGDVVRVMSIGDPAVSTELCGGTHIDNTGEIGYFHIISQGSVGAGIRRIEAVTGRQAEALIDRRLSSLEDIAQSLETTPDNVAEKVKANIEELETERRRMLSLEKDLARKDAAELLGKVENVNGINMISARISTGSQEVMREMADYLRDKLKTGIIVLGGIGGERPLFVAAVTQDLVEKGYNAGDIVKQVSKVTGGGGGGKPNFAQAGGRDKGKLDEALSTVAAIVRDGGKH